jgi:hypothetical protein
LQKHLGHAADGETGLFTAGHPTGFALHGLLLATDALGNHEGVLGPFKQSRHVIESTDLVSDGDTF